MNRLALWIALLACPVTCYFAACYLALKTFNRKRLEELLESRGHADYFQPFLDQLQRLQLMAGMFRTLSNMVVLLGLLYYFQAEYEWRYTWAPYVLAMLVGGTLVSIFGVSIPTSWARYAAEPLIARSLKFLNAAHVATRPILNFLSLADPLVRRISGPSEEEQNPDEHLSDELISVVEEHEKGEVDEDQKHMLEAVVKFRSVTAGEIMTPRTDLVGLEVSAPLDQIKQAIMIGGHSRVPVYSENLDNIVGILYSRDLTQYLGTGEPINLRQVIREALMVPETKPVRELLQDFKAKKVHIAIVLDEYGGTAGLVTIEDIIEEIIGDVEDEYEKPEEKPTIRRIDEHTAEVDARVYIDNLNDELGLELPEDQDYDTVGGFVFATLGHVPEVGETFEYDNVRVTVIDAERNKVNTVKLEMFAKAGAEPGSNGK